MVATPQVTLVPASDNERRLWAATQDLGEILGPVPWTIVGAQMVILHELEAGVAIGRTSADVDFIVDARAVATATSDATDRLVAAGFLPVEQTMDGLGLHFERNGLRVDLLAPDGLGGRASLETTIGAHTVGVPGGTQALRRSTPILLDVDGRSAIIMRPNLAAAILLKARAIGVSADRDKHRRDLCRLLGLVSDPRTMKAEMSSNERSWLRRRTELAERSNRAWQSSDEPDDAFLAYEILIG